jgi:hypothetical protein
LRELVAVAPAFPIRLGPDTDNCTGTASQSCCWKPLANTKLANAGRTFGRQAACAEDAKVSEIAIAAGAKT